MSEVVATTEVASQSYSVDLNGTFCFKVDSKGRVALPAKFRKVLPTDLVITPNPQRECLYVFTNDDFNKWVNRLFAKKYGDFDETATEQIMLRRLFKSQAHPVEVDASGRIVIPAKLRDLVGLDKEVSLIGNTGYFEIWNSASFDELYSDVDPSCIFS